MVHLDFALVRSPHSYTHNNYKLFGVVPTLGSHTLPLTRYPSHIYASSRIPLGGG